MPEPVRIIPLGGLCEVGKNMTVIEYGDDILVVDVGVAFPEAEQFGNLRIPNNQFHPAIEYEHAVFHVFERDAHHLAASLQLGGALLDDLFQLQRFRAGKTGDSAWAA